MKSLKEILIELNDLELEINNFSMDDYIDIEHAYRDIGKLKAHKETLHWVISGEYYHKDQHTKKYIIGKKPEKQPFRGRFFHY